MTPPKKEATPVPAALYSVALLPVKRLGQPEWMVVVVKTVGEKVASVTPLPDGQWDTIEGALRDMGRAAVQMYRFKNVEALLAGRV